MSPRRLAHGPRRNENVCRRAGFVACPSFEKIDGQRAFDHDRHYDDRVRNEKPREADAGRLICRGVD